MEFGKRPDQKDGFSCICKECRKDYLRKYRQKIKLENEKFDYTQDVMLKCSLCKKLKSSNLFSKCRTRKTGFSPICKPCYLSWTRKKKYGITADQLDVLLKLQNQRCAICKVPFGDIFYVDHCHKTGKVRGVLCQDCNMGIGRLKDDPTVLRSAISYLERSYLKEKSNVA